MLYARRVGLSEDVAYPLTPLFSSNKVTSRKSRGERKVSLFHTPNTGHHQFPPQFQPKRKNRDVRKKGNPHWEQENVNKGKLK